MNREEKKMAEMCIPKDPGCLGERQIFQGQRLAKEDQGQKSAEEDQGQRSAEEDQGQRSAEEDQGQRSAEKDPGLLRNPRSLLGCLTQAPLLLMLLFISLGLFMLMLITLIQVSRIQQSLPGTMDHQGSHSQVVVFQKLMQLNMEEIRQQLIWMNTTLDGLCHPCPWHWDLFQGSCYFFSRTQSTWKASVSACEEMRAQLVVINNAEEQKFLTSWDIRNNKHTWIGLSDQHDEGSWYWVDNTPLNLSFWKKGEPNNLSDEDCVELYGDGWNDSRCGKEYFWICEKPSALC